jgi:hypothetical protein
MTWPDYVASSLLVLSVIATAFWLTMQLRTIHNLVNSRLSLVQERLEEALALLREKYEDTSLNQDPG